MVKLVENNAEAWLFNIKSCLCGVSILLIFVTGLLENNLLLWM